jgi:type II secretory pathway component PulF
MKTEDLRQEARVFCLLDMLMCMQIPIAKALELIAPICHSHEKVLKEMSKKEITVAAEFEKHKESFSPFVSAVMTSSVSIDELDNAPRDIALTLKQMARVYDAGGALLSVGKVAFFAIIACLLKHGHPAISSLKLGATVALFSANEKVMLIEKISYGLTLSEALRDFNYFSEFDRGMIEIGEKSGSLPDMCTQLARLYERMIVGQSMKASPESRDTKESSSMYLYLYLATLLEAGMPLLLSLRCVQKNPTFSDSPHHDLAKICKEIEDGDTLSEAMIKCQFPEYIIAMIAKAEINGCIERAVRLIADELMWDILDIEPTYSRLLLPVRGVTNSRGEGELCMP